MECAVFRPPGCQVVVTGYPAHEVRTIDYRSCQRRHLLQLLSEGDMAFLDPKAQGSPLQRGLRSGISGSGREGRDAVCDGPGIPVAVGAGVQFAL